MLLIRVRLIYVLNFPTVIINPFLHTTKSLKRNTVHSLCIRVSDEQIYIYILLYYNMLKFQVYF